jgi:pimeloyl-ACP methyl ester carboxylesterase
MTPKRRRVGEGPRPPARSSLSAASRDRQLQTVTAPTDRLDASLDVPKRVSAPDGAVLGYRLWRPGPPRPVLVLLHGAASNLTRWSELVARTSLRDSWDLLRIDLRGYGASLHRGRVSLEGWAADLGAILAGEACPPAVLAGHCLGASVAVEFARRHPTRVAGLVLIDPIVREALAGPLRRVAQLRPLLEPGVWLLRGLNALGLHRRRLPPLDLEQLDQETRAAMGAGDVTALARRYASPREDLKTTPAVIYLQSLLATSAGLPDPAAVRVPMLALVASGALLGDPAITERILHAIPRCRVQRLEAAHWIPTERPEELRRAIDAWCRDLESRSEANPHDK